MVPMMNNEGSDKKIDDMIEEWNLS